MDLTHTIRTIRESKGLTQEDLADRLGVTRSNYAYLEGRGSKLTVEQLEKIAGVLGVTVTDLLTGEAQKVEDSEVVERLRTELEFYKPLYRKTDTLSENLTDTVIRKLSLLDMHYSPEAVEERIKILERLTEEKVIDEQEKKALMDSAEAFSNFIDPSKWGLPKEKRIGRQFVTEEEFKKELFLGGFIDSYIIKRAYELGKKNSENK